MLIDVLLAQIRDIFCVEFVDQILGCDVNQTTHHYNYLHHPFGFGTKKLTIIATTAMTARPILQKANIVKKRAIISNKGIYPEWVSEEGKSTTKKTKARIARASGGCRDFRCN
jgi:hypothetical protein